MSNPPYILESERIFMKRNVLDYEPEKSLFTDDKNPLLYYKAILVFSQISLKKNGKIYFEINQKYSNEIKDLAFYHGYLKIDCIKDMYNKNRFCVII